MPNIPRDTPRLREFNTDRRVAEKTFGKTQAKRLHKELMTQKDPFQEIYFPRGFKQTLTSMYVDHDEVHVSGTGMMYHAGNADGMKRWPTFSRSLFMWAVLAAIALNLRTDSDCARIGPEWWDKDHVTSEDEEESESEGGEESPEGWYDPYPPRHSA